MYNIEENFMNHDYARKGFRHLCSTPKLIPITGVCSKPFNKKHDIKAYQKKK